jgi:hypothetical protein
MNRLTYPRAARLLLLALASGRLAGAQTAAAAQDSNQEPDKQMTFGIRLRGFPVGALSQLGDKITHAAGTPEWLYNTTSRCPAIGFGPAMERKLTEHVTLTGEILFQRLKYNKTVDVWWGTDDSSTTADERFHSIREETTKASLWDFPLLVHFEKFSIPNVPSKLWLAGGVTFRALSSVQTTNKILNEDGTSSTNDNRAEPNKRYLVGLTVGAGFRFLDDYHTRVTPEIRYTRWSGRTFSSETTRTPSNQLEVGLALTF